MIRGDNTRISVGDRMNIQDAAVLHSDPGSPLVIGDDVTIGHGTVRHGCTIGSRVLIGMDAIILNDAIIGDDCIVGASALVVGGKTFASGSLIIGAPAPARRTLTHDEISEIVPNAEMYVRNRLQHSGC